MHTEKFKIWCDRKGNSKKRLHILLGNRLKIDTLHVSFPGKLCPFVHTREYVGSISWKKNNFKAKSLKKIVLFFGFEHYLTRPTHPFNLSLALLSLIRQTALIMTHFRGVWWRIFGGLVALSRWDFHKRLNRRIKRRIREKTSQNCRIWGK